MPTPHFRPAALTLVLLSILAACTDAPERLEVSDSHVPTADWETADPESLGLDAAAVEAFIDDVFTNATTQGVVVVRNGYIVGERYAAGAGVDTPATSWSVAKSFYSEAIGVAIEEGAIGTLDDPVADYIDEWVGTDKEAITVRMVAEMRTGLENSIEALFLAGDLNAYAVGIAPTAAIDDTFDYNNANSQLLGELIERATGEASGDFLQTRILDPIGIQPVSLWVDSSGGYLNFAGIDATTRDFARFGLLMSRGGLWGDREVLPEAYVKTSLAPGSDTFYGLHWWNYNQAYLDLMSTWFRDGAEPPTAPSHTFSMAWGAYGQYIFPWPEEDMVIAINTTYGYDEESDRPMFGLFNLPVSTDPNDAMVFSLAQHLELALAMVPAAP